MLIHHICIQTNSYDLSKDFYRNILGFQLISETANFHGRGYNSWLREAGGFMIELQTAKAGGQFSPPARRRRGWPICASWWRMWKRRPGASSPPATITFAARMVMRSMRCWAASCASWWPRRGPSSSCGTRRNYRQKTHAIPGHIWGLHGFDCIFRSESVCSPWCPCRSSRRAPGRSSTRSPGGSCGNAHGHAPHGRIPSDARPAGCRQ